MKPSVSARQTFPALAAAILLAGCGEDPRGLITEMGRAYRSAASYADDARVVVRQTSGALSTDAAFPFRVAFSRPDRIRIDAYDARIAADGTRLFAAVGGVPGQVLVEAVTSPLSMDQIFADDAVRTTLAEGEAGCPTQLPLLLADDTVDLILADAREAPRILGTETIDGRACARIEIVKPDGVLELWIDREAKLLRRMKVPTAAYAAELSRQAGGPVGISVEVEFAGASFDTTAPAEVFTFDIPAGAAEVSRLEPLQPPQPVHPQIGKPADIGPLALADGTTVSREELRGSVVVLELFFEGCGPSTHVMPQVATGLADSVAAHARRHGGERPAVRHFAVSLDPEEVTVDSIRKKLAEFGGVGTLARDPQGVLPQSLMLESFPATVILAADGTVADVITGHHGQIASDVAESLAAANASTPTGPLVRTRYERRLAGYRRELDRAAGGSTGSRLPEQVIAPRRQPVRFKLEPAWRAAGVALPGNLVCLDAAHAATDVRIVALDGWRTVVVIDAAGTEISRHELDLPADAGVSFLRTTVDSAGRRWWLAGRRGGQTVFVFTADWKLHATSRALGDIRHAGMSDADLADLDGDGTPELVVGHLGTGGVQAATLDGRPLWEDRTVAPVIDLAIGEPHAAGGGRDVLCVTVAGRIVRADRTRQEAVTPGDPPPLPLGELTAGPVAADAAWALLGIATLPGSGRRGVGIDSSSLEATWDLTLGEGTHRAGPIDAVAWADLLGTARRQWLIAAPDGSVTVAWADGRVVDRYQHGQPLVGLGGYRHDGVGYVVIASPRGLEALRVADVALD